MTATSRATILDGKALSKKVRAEVQERAERLRAGGLGPRLDAVLVKGNAGAGVYARNQQATCAELGIDYHLHELPKDSDFKTIADCIDELNANDAVHAIMAHLPLPDGVDADRIGARIAVHKDVEGVNPANIGNVVYGRRSLVPCTALATMTMIESTGLDLPGAECVCVGASTIVGKPVAVLLMQAEATVTSTNIHTRDLIEHTRRADVLISATGVPGLIKADMVKPGAVVVDVGISRVKGEDGKRRTVGDVDFDEVAAVAGYISPVPGGVGPVTVAMLLRNTVQAAEQSLAADS